MFELLFFFSFVTKYEDQALTSVFSSITNTATQSCNTLNNNDKQIVDYILGLLVNGTILENNSNQNYNSRMSYNHNLMIWAIMLFVLLFVFNILIIGINYCYYKRKINFKGIIIDNLVMISLLGLYEYFFFSYIVFNYQTTTPEELEYNIYNNVMNNC